MHRWQIRLTTADGRQLWWRKAGRIHTLDAGLGQVWVANFKPAVFQVCDDGALVPRGTPGAVDVTGVECVPAEGSAPG